MTPRSSRLRRFCLLVAFIAAALPAHAQRLVGNHSAPARPAPPPSALPGTRTESATPAPAEKLPGEMNPTDALFDGINRGDLASVKDAINRGAELDARNLLGLTPIELSIDLGHHKISFLLLSLRDAGNGGSRSAPAPTPRPTSTSTTAARLSRPQPPKTVTGSAPSPYPVAKQFAGDGAAAVPDRGFLGFGPRQ